MRNVRCLNPKCGLVISGIWKKGAPARCPRCGSDSKKLIQDAVRLQRNNDILAQNKPNIGNVPLYEN